MAQFLRLMSAQLMSSTARSLKNENMSLAELATIYLLDRDGELRINALAAALSLSMPAASRVAAALVDRGLVSRREDKEDRRARVIALTKRGRNLVDALSVSLVAEVGATLATANTPVSNRLGMLFGTMVAEGLTAAPGKKE
jgi:DNA-binding MarR family transcriptional regulator